MQGWLNIQISVNVIHCINKLKEKKDSIISKNAFDKIQHCYMIKVLEKLKIQETYLNIIKAIYTNHIPKIKFRQDKLKAIPHTHTHKKTRLPILSVLYLLDIILEVLARPIRQVKEI
jgi:serine protease inhibitor